MDSKEAVTPLEYLRIVNDVVDVVVEYSITTTDSTILTLNIIQKKQILKLFLNENYRGILKYIIEHESFTIGNVQKDTHSPKHMVHFVVQSLETWGLVVKHSKIKSRRGPPISVYLVLGGNGDSIDGAKLNHKNLVQHEDLIVDIMDRVKSNFSNQRYKSVSRYEVFDLLAEIHGERDSRIFSEIQRRMKNEGWSVS